MIRNKVAAVLLLAATLLLTACGFHMRGTMGDAKLPFKTIFVGFAQNSVIATEIKRNLRGTGAEPVFTRKEAQVMLESLGESRKKVILSLNSQGRVREYSLFYVVRFQLRDQQNLILLAPTEIALRRTMNYSETEALSKEGEEDLLYRDMQKDAAQQIVRRLSAVTMPPEGTTIPAAATAPAKN